jgi:hypothetical protein
MSRGNYEKKRRKESTGRAGMITGFNWKEKMIENKKERKETETLERKGKDPLPLRELCEYVKLREREEAMAKCGFFQKLQREYWTHQAVTWEERYGERLTSLAKLN